MRKTHACKRAACVFCISLQFGCTYLGSYMHMGTKVGTSKHFQIHKCLKNCCSPPIKKTNVKMFAVRKRVSILFQNPLSCDTFHRQFVTSLYFGLCRFWRGVKKNSISSFRKYPYINRWLEKYANNDFLDCFLLNGKKII